MAGPGRQEESAHHAHQPAQDPHAPARRPGPPWGDRSPEVAPSHRIAGVHLSNLRSRLPSVENLIEAGRDHYQQEDLEAALEQWRNALLIEPGNTQALEYVARAERLLENLERLREEPGVNAEAP